MKPETKQVLSVSRRTDIPAFYMPWFMEQVTRGVIDVVNPFNRRIRQVNLSPQQVHTLVFWSKNFGPFLAERCGEQLQAMGYRLFFNFTINSRSPLLEPAVPDLDRRLEQIEQLCRRFGPDRVQWRFDPICHFTTPAGDIQNNLADFETIATAAGQCGIGTCITSFMDHYRKIERRTHNNLSFCDPPMNEKVGILLNMQATLSRWETQLHLCCEKEVLAALPPASTIGPAACISGERIMAVHGGRVSVGRDSGQRRSSGCGCSVSIDVGSYHLHPCHHNCLYCYANPACDQRRRQ